MIQTLYRKYRPTKLSDVVGQSGITTALENALKTQNFSHAYLFIGPRGTGKTSVARIFAHAVNGFDYQIEDQYLDIIEIDAASNRGIDNIRELREKVMVTPTAGKYKIYIIDEVHMLTKEAANALLKTLEEPPEHVIFILATTDAHKVPITISSRTQIFTFQLANPETMFQHLRKIADLEKISITDDALEIVVKRGGGSFRDSLSLLDQISTLSDKEITSESLEKALGLPQNQLIQDILQNYAVDLNKTMQSLQKMFDSGLRASTITNELIAEIVSKTTVDFANISKNLSVINYTDLLERLTKVTEPFAEAKLTLALLKNHPNLTPKPPQTTQNTTNSAQYTPKSPQTASEAPRTADTPKEPSYSTSSSDAPKMASTQVAAPRLTPTQSPVVKQTHSASQPSQKSFKKPRPWEKPRTTSESAKISQESSPFSQISDIMGGGEEVSSTDLF